MSRFETRSWSGEDWEELVHSLLLIRYGIGDYQRVPATHDGDCGLEAYSTDGHVYQCYAAQEYNSTDALYEKQRDKMSTDIRKFIQNRERLTQLFGSFRVRRWLLVVPDHKSSKLIAHASRKTDEVLEANLPYVDADFRVGVFDAHDLGEEYRQLTDGGGAAVSFDPVDVTEDQVEAFNAVAENSELLRNLRDKLARVPLLAPDSERRSVLVNHLTHGYLRGQAYLGVLHKDHPQLFRKFDAFKRRKENELALLSLVSTPQHDGRLEAQIRELGQLMGEELPTVVPMIDALVTEAIADWLMRCPLNFFNATEAHGAST